MFGIFDSKTESSIDAKILFGSKEEDRETKVERKSPFDGKVVSRYPVCSAADANKALEIAQKAAKAAAMAPLYQRISWLEDVANNLRKHEDEFAKLIVDEIAKCIKSGCTTPCCIDWLSSLSREEVDRILRIVENGRSRK